ncbi:MAG: LysM peptidoglycan-binding domain-containing protein [Prevotella sp.]|nr:LysM peptidoglycan-binding domain-containing protein [Prevotella sp.]MDD7190841.1 LysM peptidoglycan-binding domain-containing protein [Prevotella sp.]MDY5314485.1 LysM peptidoglycan-binding domain-containing protein [Prevotella sp.]
MKMFLRYALVVFASLFCFQSFAQTQNWREKYQVKKKDTLYGIAKKYNISVDALIEANPEMKVDGFELKKGSYVCIPYAASGTSGQTSATPVRTLIQTASRQFSGKTVRVGVMLPLHDVDGDGRRMTEFYRGMLMACDSLRAEGMNIDIHAWNVNIDADITNFIKQPGAAKCDIIFGPLYSKQVHALAEFCKARDIQMVIPFSITGDDVSMYKQIFQVYQTNDRQTNNSIETFLKLFPNCHPVFIDCNDKTSTKGNFTFGLRTRLESHNIGYGITNIGSSDDLFAKQFSQNSQNIVILNTGRSPELTLALNKLAILKANNPTLKIKLFGYTEWMMYLGIDEAKFHEFDTYIPSTFYYNPASPRTQSLTRSYRQWFKTDMQNALPRFALTGYDYAQFFLRGFAKYGKAFRGVKNQNSWKAVQAPLRFKQVGAAGMQNDFFQLVHFMPNGNVEAISY